MSFFVFSGSGSFGSSSERPGLFSDASWSLKKSTKEGDGTPTVSVKGNDKSVGLGVTYPGIGGYGTSYDFKTGVLRQTIDLLPLAAGGKITVLGKKIGIKGGVTLLRLTVFTTLSHEDIFGFPRIYNDGSPQEKKEYYWNVDPRYTPSSTDDKTDFKNGIE